MGLIFLASRTILVKYLTNWVPLFAWAIAMHPARRSSSSELHDEFPQSRARDTVVGLVRGYGALQREMEPYFAGFGLTPPQFQMLTIINRLRGQPVTQRRLAAELYVSFPNVTIMLGRMEEAGLIRRRVNPADRRAKFVELTVPAQTVLRRIWKVHQAQLDQVTAGLTEKEQVALTHLLGKMIAGMPEADGNAQSKPARPRPQPSVATRT